MISFRWFHGLGDTANFAFLCKYYISRGFNIAVQTDYTKQCLFEAAGCSLADSPDAVHPYLHAPPPGKPLPSDHWSGNKLAWNVSRYPLPNVGGYWDVWDELCQVELNLDPFVSREMVEKITPLVDRNTILFHPQGNTGVDNKNLTHDQQRSILSDLLDRTDAKVILLDWDGRVALLNNRRVYHLSELGHWSVPELYYAIKRAGLVVGVDSGVLHLTRLTNTPAVGIWTKNLPSHYALPRTRTVHVSHPCEINAMRRTAFRIVDNGDPAAVCAEVFYDGPDAVFKDYLIRHARSAVNGLPVDRQRSFALLREMAPGNDWLEIGCVRQVEDWSAGYSSYLFTALGANLTSVDISRANLDFATWVTGGKVTTIHSSGEQFLKETNRIFDVIYLDGADVGTPDYPQYTLREAEALLPRLKPGGLVLIDDCGKDGGKGQLAIPFLQKHGFAIVYEGYQVLLRKS